MNRKDKKNSNKTTTYEKELAYLYTAITADIQSVAIELGKIIDTNRDLCHTVFTQLQQDLPGCMAATQAAFNTANRTLTNIANCYDLIVNSRQKLFMGLAAKFIANKPFFIDRKKTYPKTHVNDTYETNRLRKSFEAHVPPVILQQSGIDQIWGIRIGDGKLDSQSGRLNFIR